MNSSVETVPVYRIPIDQIEILDRRRKDYGDLSGLAESIRSSGQITPGTVRRAGPSDEGVDASKTPWILVAGGRRFAACAVIGLDTFKAEDLGDLPPLKRRIVELEENLHRKDLSIEEELFSKEEIHNLRKAEAESEGRTWTQKDTAEVVGESHANVSRDLQLAEEVRKDPTLLKIGSKVGMMRHLKFERTIAERTARTNQTTYVRVKDKLVTADMRDFIRTLPDHSIDLTFSDFKFGIDYDFDAGDPSAYEDSAESLKDLLTDVIPQMIRVTKPTGWLALMMGSTNYEFLKNVVQSCCTVHFDYCGQARIGTADCKFVRAEDPEWIWFRPNSRNPSKWPELHAQNQYEKFCVANLGQAVMVQKNLGNVLVHDAIYEDRIHEMQRPHPLCVDVISRLTVGGETVADFCFGSGSALAAAAELQRDFIGCDINPANLSTALVWVSEHYGAPPIQRSV